MKITNETLCNIIEKKTNSIYYELLGVSIGAQGYIENEGDKLVNNELIFSLNNNSDRKIVLSSNVRNIINDCKIDINKDFRFDVLKTLPNRYDIIQLDENICFKYIKRNNSIYCQMFKLVSKHVVEISDFFVSLSDNKEYLTSTLKVKEIDKDLFLRIITFLELTDVSLKFIKH